MLTFLQPIVEPSAQAVKECACAADYWSYFPRVLMSFEAHTKPGHFVGVPKYGLVEVLELCFTY